jgi:hypothetical protein
MHDENELAALLFQTVQCKDNARDLRHGLPNLSRSRNFNVRGIGECVGEKIAEYACRKGDQRD